LYINLAVGVISKWTSQVDASAALKGGVKALIEQLFETLERDFGRRLVRMALSFLTFSVKGVNTTEMEDLMSLDKEVMDSVFQYATPTVRRLPSHVWLRLKGAMDGLVMEGEHGCYQWYHRQLKETAETRFREEKPMVHALMATYFGNLVDDATRQQGRISQQNWTLRGNPFDNSSLVNARRCYEATFHPLESKPWAQAEEEMCDFAGICSELRAGEGFQLVRDLVTLLTQVEEDSWANADADRAPERQRDRVYHYLRWLREEVHYLTRSPIQTFLSSAAMQPQTSLLRQDALAFWTKCKER
jgi:hypothetical protein